MRPLLAVLLNSALLHWFRLSVGSFNLLTVPCTIRKTFTCRLMAVVPEITGPTATVKGAVFKRKCWTCWIVKRIVQTISKYIRVQVIIAYLMVQCIFFFCCRFCFFFFFFCFCFYFILGIQFLSFYCWWYRLRIRFLVVGATS